MVHRKTTSDNEWQRMTTSDNEWKRMVQRVTTNDNEWPISANFSLFQIREKLSPMHLKKENLLNLGHWIQSRNKPLRRNINSKKQELQKQLFADFLQNSVLKNFCNILLLIDLRASRPATFLKRDTNTGIFLCWSPFLRKLQVLKPTNLLKGDSNTGVFLWILQNC